MENSLDKADWIEYVNENQKRLRHYAFNVTRNVQNANDLVGDTFYYAYKNYHNFDPKKGPFGGWLYKILSNKCNDWLKSHHYNNPMSQFPKDFDIADKEWEEKDIKQEKEDLRIDSHACLSNLKGNDHYVIVLDVLEGVPQKDIADILQKEPGNVKVIKHRALEKIRRCLERKGYTVPKKIKATPSQKFERSIHPSP